MPQRTQVPREPERELDIEPEEEFEEFVEYVREHRDEDEQDYGESGDEDIYRDTVDEDPKEFHEV